MDECDRIHKESSKNRMQAWMNVIEFTKKPVRLKCECDQSFHLIATKRKSNCQKQEETMANYDSDDMKAMFLTLGFNENAVQDLVEEQGIDTLDCLLALNVKGVEALCKNIRNPGGTVQDDDDTPAVPARGNPITTIAELYLKKTVFYLKHMERTSRIAHPNDVTIETISAFTAQEEAEEKYVKPTLPTSKEFITPEMTWPNVFKQLDSILRKSRGNSGIPLAYCVRKDTEPTMDPAEGWDSYDDEMIARAPIKTADGKFHPQFIRDNNEVWDIIAELTSKQECYVQAEKDDALKRRNGRLAYWNLFNHYCGTSDAANRVSNARALLSSLVYHGETKRFTFEKYIALHTEQHNIINSLKETPEGGIDELAKVQLFYDGILDPKLESVKPQLFANEEKYRRNFTNTVALYKQVMDANSSSKKRSIQVSAIAQQKPYQPYKKASQPNNNNGWQQKKGKEKSKKGGKGGSRSSRKITADEVEDRFYPYAEYNRFTPEARTKLHDLRENNRNSKKRKVSFTNSSATHSSRRDDDGDSSDDQSAATPPRNNRSNRALTRQRSRRS